jgi:glycosyltransferase involved in cell wall biosynthesis
MNKPNISVFFPVYNDEKTIENVTRKSLDILEIHANEFEVLIIDDCSPDNSGKIADQLSLKYQNVRVIHHDKNYGYGAALKTGFQNVRYDFICQTDGDDEYEITDLEKFIKLYTYYDLIITFRYVRMYSNWRIFVSRIYNMTLRYLFRHNYRDISTGLRFVRREVLLDIMLLSNSPFIGAELAIKAMLKGYRVGEVGIQTFPREFGTGAAVSTKNICLTIKDMIRVYRQIFSRNYDLPINRTR